jgi:SulP family sulfate permease
MPGGGSLSGTALNVASGAKTRWAFIFQGIVALALVLVFGDLLGLIPMSALAAMLILIGAQAIRFPAIKAVMGSTPASIFSMIATFIATLVIPLQQAVVLGVIVAAVLFIYRSSSDIQIYAREETEKGPREIDPPADLPSDRVTVLDIYGSLFYAGARTLGKLLPKPEHATHAVVVLRVRGRGQIGTTFLDVVSRYAERVRANGGRLLLSGLEPDIKERMARTGHLAKIGEENIYLATSYVGESTRAAFEEGQAWLNTLDRQDEETVPVPT